eukprot:scaffold52205_cov75-Phaeocystis_antarctica.AAC.2
MVVGDDHVVQPLPPPQQVLERRNDQPEHHQIEDEPARREGEQHKLVPERRCRCQAGLRPGVEEDAPREPQGLTVVIRMGQLQARVFVVIWIAPAHSHPSQRTAQDQDSGDQDEQRPVAIVRAKHCAGECVARTRPRRPEKWTHPEPLCRWDTNSSGNCRAARATTQVSCDRW